MISIDQSSPFNNISANNNNSVIRKKFSVEKILEENNNDMQTMKRCSANNSNSSLKFGVESYILKVDNDVNLKKLKSDNSVSRPQSPINSNNAYLGISSRSPSLSEIYSYSSYVNVQPSYRWSANSCDPCLVVNSDPCFHHLMSATYSPQIMTHTNFNKHIGDSLYPSNSSQLLQNHYSSHYAQSNVRDADHASNQCGKRKRSWSRAVFSNLQRKGLEKRFLIQKYITKPDRRQLAATLGLTDAQVKVWFQNRRMKWRHSKEYKEDLSKTNANKDQHSSVKSEEIIDN